MKGSGRGDTFSTPANGGMGTLDWDDVHTMTTEAIKQNILDPNRLAIAGWSQGGFLTAWGCTRPPVKEQRYQFKAGIVGAGPTDWGSMAITSDMPDYEVSTISFRVCFLMLSWFLRIDLCTGRSGR